MGDTRNDAQRLYEERPCDREAREQMARASEHLRRKNQEVMARMNQTLAKVAMIPCPFCLKETTGRDAGDSIAVEVERQHFWHRMYQSWGRRGG